MSWGLHATKSLLLFLYGHRSEYYKELLVVYNISVIVIIVTTIIIITNIVINIIRH